MLKVTLHHTPQYFQFYIQDPVHYSHEDGAEAYRAADLARFICDEGRLTILVQSEYSEIPITVQYDAEELPLDTDLKWERIIQCPLNLWSSELVFCGCPDGPDHGRFGELAVRPGPYVVRVYYGGQSSVERDGTTHDFYFVQVWPGSAPEARVLREPT